MKLEEITTSMNLDVESLEIRLMFADKMAWWVDKLVVMQLIDARSGIADARSNYGEPFKYIYDPSLKPYKDEEF